MSDSTPPVGAERRREGHGRPASPPAIPPELGAAELEAILRSKAFSHSERLRRLLRFTVERTLEGQGDQLKEYLLGVEVFQKGDSFDPRMDPVVRVEFHRLRARLKTHYEGEGRASLLRIEYPKGSYAPIWRRAAAATSLLGRMRAWIGSRKKTVTLALLALATLLVTWLVLPSRISPGKNAPQDTLASIAVLPFTDLSPGRDQEYFCDGITDELINSLGKVESLRVVSRTSVFQFKGGAMDVRKIGRQLNVSAVLEGSVRRAGSRVRITAQLIKVADAYQLWSGAYDREMNDVFTLQEDISRAILRALRVRLPGRLLEGRPGNLDAYNLYLKGRYHWNKRTDVTLGKSIDYFVQAIAADPSWAVSHAALADSYAMVASYGLAPPKEAMLKAKAAAAKALEIDPSLAQAHATLGFIRSFCDWDWPGAEREYQRAIELNPGYATAHQWYSGCLRAMGRLEKAMAEIRRAQDLDPLSVAIGRDLGRVYHASRQYDRAVEQYRSVLELDPNFPSVYLHLAMAYAAKGMHKEALAALRKARTLPGGNPVITGALGYCYGLSGNRAEAAKLLAELSAVSRQRYVSPISRALIYIGLGDRDQAFRWLDHACDARDPWLAWLNADPVFDSLRSDARYPLLLKRVGL